jgi:hypothetical protein
VQWNGRIYEAICALLERRTASELYHSALEVTLPPDFWIIEMTPVWAVREGDRGVVTEGAVGARWTGRGRWFRYEIHCWRRGVISDVAQAVESPVRLSSDPAMCRRVLALLPTVPNAVWGRDEQDTGEMWSSNSVTSWTLARCGIYAEAVRAPRDGRAPGWSAGIAVAETDARTAFTRTPAMGEPTQ